MWYFLNGNAYWVDQKIEYGQPIRYEQDKDKAKRDEQSKREQSQKTTRKE